MYIALNKGGLPNQINVIGEKMKATIGTGDKGKTKSVML